MKVIIGEDLKRDLSLLLQGKLEKPEHIVRGEAEPKRTGSSFDSNNAWLEEHPEWD